MPADDSPLTIYKDDDLVYVDPDARTVVAKVEWSQSGQPKSLQCSAPANAETPVRGRRRSCYPWGTYRSMKKIYHLEGKKGKEQPTATLDDVLSKALEQPYWD